MSLKGIFGRRRIEKEVEDDDEDQPITSASTLNRLHHFCQRGNNIILL